MARICHKSLELETIIKIPNFLLLAIPRDRQNYTRVATSSSTIPKPGLNLLVVHLSYIKKNRCDRISGGDSGDRFSNK
ncbi:MAG: hypothetical protein RIM23_21910 [Coleofasciculus sp. G3-WIS-01]|uniref:hypothetical protein n=1 Tax=Coleofasciculus sp. G3-WIS-01 TaxID=3069528 RepID=UPI0032F53C87